MSLEAVRQRSSFLIAFCAASVTLLISPFSSLDPINLVKILALASIAFALFPLTVIVARRSNEKVLRWLYGLGLSFVGWMLLVVFLTDAPINQQVWGVFGRNTGMLTYISLLLILVAAASIQHQRTYALLVKTLIITSIPVLFYTVIQFVGKDPISWSQMAPFGTLGNINFSSAFFGMSSIAMTAMALGSNLNLVLRISLFVIVSLKMFLIASTGSIQGLMIYLAGVAVVLYFYISTHSRIRFLRIPYVIVSAFGLLMAGAGLFNQGPLARIIFGETVLFRYDYWYAGWMMSLRNPWFGVGLDSYGDWYRELRGEVATLRTVPDRITNSAHNIYLDISSGGGFPLLFLYLAILGLAFSAIVRRLRLSGEFDPIFVSLASVWVAYVIQAGISINQVGVGVWGWAITGALIGYRGHSKGGTQKDKAGTQKSRSSSSQMPLNASLLAMVGFALGFLLAFIPFQTDARYRDAQESGSLSSAFSVAQALGGTAYHLELALDSALQANDAELAELITDELLTRYPRDFMAWRVRQSLTSSTPSERDEAYRRLRQLDPYNPEIRPSG